MEIETYTLVGRESVLLKFNSDEYGIFGANFEVGENLAVTHGIALKNLGPAKFRSINKGFEFWYSFKAQTLGHASNMSELSEETITLWAKRNERLICHSLADIESDWAHRFNFKRAKRPLVCVETSEGPCWGVLWEVYPSMARLGVYIGVDSKGLGGHVQFFDRHEFKIL